MTKGLELPVRRPMTRARRITEAGRRMVSAFGGAPRTSTYSGEVGKQVVWVGSSGISPLGSETQMRQIFFNGKLDAEGFLPLAVKMGIVEITRQGDILEKMGFLPDGSAAPAKIPVKVANLGNRGEIVELQKRWDKYIDDNTGPRPLTERNIGWDPATFRDPAKRRERAQLPVDFGGPVPTGWNCNLGIDSQNSGIDLAHEAVAAALVNAGLWGGGRHLTDYFDGLRAGVNSATGVGPFHEMCGMFADAEIHNKAIRPLQLPHVLSNTPVGYIADRLRVRRKIETTSGACESSFGAIGSSYHDLKGGIVDLSVAVSYETALTPPAQLGFSGLKALMTNQRLVDGIRKRLELGLLPKDVYEPILREIDANGIWNLPKSVTRFASTPQDLLRGGFVNSEGTGAGAFMTLDRALELGSPILAFVAGVGDKIRDSHTDGGHVAEMGDGIGTALEIALWDAFENYADLRTGGWWNSNRGPNVNLLACLLTHGTSTPLGDGVERENYHRIMEKLGRLLRNPLLLTGTKDLEGHRIAGNWPSLVHMMFALNLIKPFFNYFQPGRHHKTGELLDGLNRTAVVGPAGVGGGRPVPLHGDYIAASGAGFGNVNSVILFRRFRPEELPLRVYQRYRRKLAENRQHIDATQANLDCGWSTYFEKEE